MKKIFILIICLIVCLSSFMFVACKDNVPDENAAQTYKGEEYNIVDLDVAKEDPSEFKIMSFNLRLKTITDTGMKSWSKRRDYVAEMVKKNDPDIICFQEAKGSQPEEVAERLKDYAIIYYERGDGEGLAIAFKNKYKIIEKGIFWLSETPEEKSKGFGASFYRICVYAALENKATGEKITVTNVHLDHLVKKARHEGIKLIIERMKKFSGALVICGDFNCTSTSGEDDGYNAAAEILQDSQKVAKETEEGNTYNNWGTKTSGEAIDFIFVSDHYEINKFEILDEHKVVDGKKLYYSDHYAIQSSIVIK